MSLAQNKALVRRYYEEMWNRWDFALADELIGEGISFRGSLGVSVEGREGFKEYMRAVRRAFPDFHNHVEELIAEGDRVAARLTYTGTHQGELFGIAATGRRVSYAGAALFRVAGGRLVEGWVLGDVRGLVEQLRGEEPVGVVTLRPTTPDDLDFVLEAERHPDNARYILPWTRGQHAQALADPDLCHRIILHPDGRRVGFVLLAGLTGPHGSVEFRRIVVTAKGQGLGRAAVRLVKRFAFEERRAHRLWLDVKERNDRARRLYESEGFVVEGVLRECLRGEGGFDSLVVMSMLGRDHGGG